MDICRLSTHMMIWFHLSKYACGTCIALHTKEPGRASKHEVSKDLQHRIITKGIGRYYLPALETNKQVLAPDGIHI
jgi:hypothetical protein